MAKGTSTSSARERASRVLPDPVGPSSKMFDLSSSSGSPAGRTIVASKFAPHLVEQVKTTLQHDDPALRERWDSIFKTASSDAKDLLKRLLALHPKERITAHEALDHAYVAQFHMPNVERTAAHNVHVPIDDCEKKSTAAYRNMLYEEVTRMKRQSDHAYAAAGGGVRERGGQSASA